MTSKFKIYGAASLLLFGFVIYVPFIYYDKHDERTYLDLSGDMEGCNAGKGSSCYDLGRLYQWIDFEPTSNGFSKIFAGKFKDIGTAFAFYKKGCELGSGHACEALEDSEGDSETKKNFVALYQKSCDGNDDFGCYRLYLKLLGKSQTEAINALKRACSLKSEHCSVLEAEVSSACRQGNKSICSRGVVGDEPIKKYHEAEDEARQQRLVDDLWCACSGAKAALSVNAGMNLGRALAGGNVDVGSHFGVVDLANKIGDFLDSNEIYHQTRMEKGSGSSMCSTEPGERMVRKCVSLMSRYGS